jgi:hypothetical protein
MKHEGIFFDPNSVVQQEEIVETRQINDPETGIIPFVESRQERSFAETVSG